MKVVSLMSAILFILFAASAGGSHHSFLVTVVLASWFVLAQILGGGECGTGGGGGGTPNPPTVTSVTPSSGPTTGGTAVTISGTNFALGATVSFGGVAATNVVVLSPTSLTATTPPGTAGPVTVSVTTTGGTGSLPNGYTYLVVPTVTGVVPNSGTIAGGTAVTITGTNFAAGATVTFGGIAATSVVVVNATTITCVTPARATAGAVAVAVTVNAQTGSLANAFTYTAPIYGGVGAAGATSGTLSGTTVTLDNGATLNQLQTTPEVAGTSNWPFSPNNQVIYLLLRGSGHTIFRDTNTGFAFPFNTPPIAIPNIGGSTLYLYQCTNAVFTPPGPYQILVVN